jgi:hypothetical protein
MVQGEGDDGCADGGGDQMILPLLKIGCFLPFVFVQVCAFRSSVQQQAKLAWKRVAAK